MDVLSRAEEGMEEPRLGSATGLSADDERTSDKDVAPPCARTCATTSGVGGRRADKKLT